MHYSIYLLFHFFNVSFFQCFIISLYPYILISIYHYFSGMLKLNDVFFSYDPEQKLLQNINLSLDKGEHLCVMGESGCGKTTLSKLIMRALAPDQGSIVYNDRGTLMDVFDLEAEETFKLRRQLQFIFQDPFSSLNPRMTVFDVIREPLVIHKLCDRAEQAEMVKELLRLVGLDPRFLNRYPHSFSGGQRQRIGIARALALRPDFLICDEPVSALDVSIQAQILNLLKELQEALGPRLGRAVHEQLRSDSETGDPWKPIAPIE